jgi:CheY-like chemotaxis protein
MPQGGKITIQAENIVITTKSDLPLKSGNYLKITIMDQGHGIPKKYLDKIFDLFFTTTKKAAGMGLTVAYAIIKNHAGYLTVESELGKGTAASFYLPATLPSLDSAWITTDLLVARTGKILLMDDDEMILEVIGAMLEKLGYTVALAKDGAAALELFKLARQTEQPFDAVILDSTMAGGMGGLETLIKLQEIDPQVKAIISSGYADDPVMADFAKYGFCGKLPKPYRMTKLSETINDILKSDHN